MLADSRQHIVRLAHRQERAREFTVADDWNPGERVPPRLRHPDQPPPQRHLRSGHLGVSVVSDHALYEFTAAPNGTPP
ncbi:hypothetical protein ACE1SV_62030 [Streptomyces sp. E-15]